MHIQQAYNAWSDTYDVDDNLTRDLDQTVTEKVLGNLRVNSLLEIGCGTGKNTPLLAQIGKSVTAVDFSAGMIAQAKAKVKAQNVTFQEADITRPWPVADASQQLITCNLILEHIADLDFIFSEVSRSLQVGGLLFISELHSFKQYLGSQARFKRDEETTLIPAFLHHTSDFLTAAQENDFALLQLNEWWHGADEGKPPRLISFLFKKQGK
jgi:malonyl-CoA O-methyltransferase